MISDDELLAIVANERRRSVGFDHDGTLSGEREKALLYLKGEMPDVPNVANRSSAVSTDVSDAVETALPDLVEIFIGGDDVATFQPQGPDDEEQAKQETEFVLHTVFEQNPGFLLFYTIIKDALTAKIGVAKSWWEDHEETDEQQHTVPAEQWPMALQLAQQNGYEITDTEQTPDGVSFTASKTTNAGCQRNMAVPPEDFSFAADTVLLAEATYCAMRSRPRAQSLLDDGYDPEQVDRLPEYGSGNQDATEQARDTAGENEHRPIGAIKAMRSVEIVEHYVRVDYDDDGKTELVRVVTGAGETILLEKEVVDRVPFALITPYIVTHRLMGRSLADLLMEIQRIKTALLRMLLDDGYFALNQRLEVATDRMNQWTISDLLRNEPGVPIRSKTGDAVRPVSAGGLNFDVTGAIEQVNVMAEQRTGIVRNAQGLNPDTLHDTASGAQALVAAAQKRIRLVARVMAETGIKDLFLNVHYLLRKHGQQATAYLGGQWAQIDPSQWPERKALKVEIGVGSGGREHDLIAGQQLGMMLQTAMTAQGGIDGPLTNAAAANKYLVRQTERLGFKQGEQYWTDPKAFAQAQAQKPPQPDPKMAEAQQKAQVAMMQAQAQAQQAQQKAVADAQLAQAKAQNDHELRMVEAQAKAQLAEMQARHAADLNERQVAQELAMKAEEVRAQLAIKAAAAAHQAETNRSVAESKISTAGADVHPGGEPG